MLLQSRGARNDGRLASSLGPAPLWRSAFLQTDATWHPDVAMA
jgi:hypothetical protein